MRLHTTTLPILNAVESQGTSSGAAPSAPVKIGRARLRDVDGIVELVNSHTADGSLLRRERAEVQAKIDRFVVARAGELIVGCAALEPVDSHLVEVRSVIVSATHRRFGLGSALVGATLALAKRRGFSRMFCLTRRTTFFARLGFLPADKSSYPQKVMKDCLPCPRRHMCDEFAMERPISRRRANPRSTARLSAGV